MILHHHRYLRDRLYNRIPYFWHDLFGEEYALFDCHIMTPDEVAQIREATERTGIIFHKTAHLLRALPDDTLLKFGYPEASLDYIRFRPISQPVIIGRMDWVETPDGPKLLEYNADTPTFIKECFDVNGTVCHAFGKHNPNEGETAVLAHEVKKAIIAAWQSLGREGTPVVVFTSHADHEEDKWTTRFLQEIAGIPSEYVSLADLRLVEKDRMENGERLEAGVYTPGGRKIDVLYRQTYPIEHLVLDRDPETGENIGEMLIRLVLDQKVAVLNPPSAFLLQSKAVQALIWELHEERHEVFTEEEHEWIGRYFLPTYMMPTNFLIKKKRFVKKPAFGREGDTVTIYDENGTSWQREAQQTYEDEVKVYQAFCPLPAMTIRTTEGPKAAHRMIGCFCLNGKASAIGIRAGAMITNNASYYLPAGCETTPHKGV